MFDNFLALLAFVVSRLAWLCQKENESNFKYYTFEEKEALKRDGYLFTKLWTQHYFLGYVITGKNK